MKQIKPVNVKPNLYCMMHNENKYFENKATSTNSTLTVREKKWYKSIYPIRYVQKKKKIK